MNKRIATCIIFICMIFSFSSSNLAYGKPSPKPKPQAIKVVNYAYDGGLYSGYMLNSKPNGAGTYVIKDDSSEIILTGTFKNGLVTHGTKTEIDQIDGKTVKAIGTLDYNLQGNREGHFKYFLYKNDVLCLTDEGFYKDGYKNGLFTYLLYENGKVSFTRKQRFVEGVRYYTEDNFNQIEIGMWKGSVESILGEGTLLCSYEIDNVKKDHYEWGNSNVGDILITFENGNVTSKSQLGIKYKN